MWGTMWHIFWIFLEMVFQERFLCFRWIVNSVKCVSDQKELQVIFSVKVNLFHRSLCLSITKGWSSRQGMEEIGWGSQWCKIQKWRSSPGESVGWEISVVLFYWPKTVIVINWKLVVRSKIFLLSLTVQYLGGRSADICLAMQAVGQVVHSL